MQIVYVVTMQRWGDSETHNYVQGVFTSVEEALSCGQAERSFRGGKYEPKITEHILDEHDIEALDYHKECQ